AFCRGDVVRGADFDVRIEDADAEGVRELVFAFPRPLDDPAYCFYLTTIDCGAARLRFHGSQGSAAAADSEQTRALSAEPTTAVAGSEQREIPAAGGIATAIRRLESGDASAAETLFRAIQFDRSASFPAAA